MALSKEDEEEEEEEEEDLCASFRRGKEQESSPVDGGRVELCEM